MKQFKSEKSNAEIEIKEFIKDIRDKTSVSLSQFFNLESRLAKLLLKCEELRKSRDNHKNNYKLKCEELMRVKKKEDEK